MKNDPITVRRAIGRRMAALRTACGITQEQLAEGSGVDVRYLQRIEAGERNTTVDTLVRIANVLRVGVSSLFAREPAPSARPRGGRPGATAPRPLSATPSIPQGKHATKYGKKSRKRR